MKKYSIGIDLGGTKILIALIDRENGTVIEHDKKKTKKEKGPENIIKKMVCGIEELLLLTSKQLDEIYNTCKSS